MSKELLNYIIQKKYKKKNKSSYLNYLNCIPFLKKKIYIHFIINEKNKTIN